jgi:hypothetical protein
MTSHTIILPPITLLLLLSTSICYAAEVASSPGPAAGLISGQIITDANEPLTSGRVALFSADIGPPSRHGNLRRVPEVITAITADGNFSVRLPAGRYYLGAMSRDMSRGPGPPTAGENALSAVTGNKPLIIDVAEGTETELGPITVRSRVRYPDQANYFTVTGKVSDLQGKPFAGAYIFVKIDPDSQRPNFISEKIGRNGRFKIKLPAGKSYHLLAKDTVSSGKPLAGKHIGAYNGPGLGSSIIPAPAPIAGKKDEVLAGIDIIMHEVSSPGSQKPVEGEAGLDESQENQPTKKMNGQF